MTETSMRLDTETRDKFNSLLLQYQAETGERKTADDFLRMLLQEYQLARADYHD